MGRGASWWWRVVKALEARLRRVEAAADAWVQRQVEAMTEVELEAFIATFPPDPELDAALAALRVADLERAARGELSDAQIRVLYRRTR